MVTTERRFQRGDRVRWVSSKTGREHTGEVVSVGPVGPPFAYLVSPDGDRDRWVAWENWDRLQPEGRVSRDE